MLNGSFSELVGFVLLGGFGDGKFVRYGACVLEDILVVHRQDEAEFLHPIPHIHRFLCRRLHLGVGKELLDDEFELADLVFA